MVDVEEYRLAIELSEKESDRYWNRSNVILLVQGALATVVANQAYHLGRTLLICALGLFVSLLWLGVLYKGKLYVTRWSNTAKRVELNEVERRILAGERPLYPILRYYEEARIPEPRKRLPYYSKNTTTLMMWLARGVMGYWLLLAGMRIVEHVCK
jgi:hypothetical protein